MSKSIEPVTSEQFTKLVSTEIGGVINLIGDYQNIVNEDSVNVAITEANNVRDDLTDKHGKVNSILAEAQAHNIFTSTIANKAKDRVEELAQEAALEAVTVQVKINETKTQLSVATAEVVAAQSRLEDDINKAKTQNTVAIEAVIATANANRVTTLQETEQALIASNSNYSIEDIKSATVDLTSLRDAIKSEADDRIKDAEEAHAKELKTIESKYKAMTTEAEESFTVEEVKMLSKLTDSRQLLEDVRQETAELKAVYNKLVEVV